MYNEDTLVQTTTADYLQHALKWDESKSVKPILTSYTT